MSEKSNVNKGQNTLEELTKSVKKKANIFIVISILCSVLTFIMSIHTNNLQNNKALLQKYSQQLKDASDLLTNEVRLYAVTGEQIHYDNYWAEVKETKARDHALENIKKIGIRQEESTLIETSKEKSDALIKLEEESMQAVKDNNLPKAQGLVVGEAYNKAKAEVDSYVYKFQETLLSRVARQVKVSQIELMIISLLTIITLGISLVIVLDYAKKIKQKVVEPIIELKSCFEKISEGDLNVTIAYPEDGSEIGEFAAAAKSMQKMLKTYIEDITFILSNMAKGNMTHLVEREYVGDFRTIKTAINDIATSLNNTFKDMNDSANQVATGSYEVAQGSTDLAQGATEQASIVQEFIASVQEISDKIKQNIDHIKQTNKLVAEGNQNANESSSYMNEMVDAMVNIDASSNEIAQIIKVIDSIAAQTNLLALNAAIESARAGEAGKGFAVVANEIRDLANKSSEAVKNITQLIQDSVAKVTRGKKITENTSQALEKILSSVEKVEKVMVIVRENSEQQNQSLDELLKGTEQIATVVEMISSTSEESAAISEELSAQAESLNQLISQFKLRK